jgi:SRSO17 transposase
MQRERTVLRFLQRRFPSRTKHENALAQINHMHDTGLRVGGILVDAGYSLSALFRHTLTERSLIWVVAPLAGRMSIRPILR